MRYLILEIDATTWDTEEIVETVKEQCRTAWYIASQNLILGVCRGTPILLVYLLGKMEEEEIGVIASKFDIAETRMLET